MSNRVFYFNNANKNLNISKRHLKKNKAVLFQEKPLEIVDMSTPEAQTGAGVSRSSERYESTTSKPFKDLQSLLQRDTSNKFISFGKL